MNNFAKLYFIWALSSFNFNKKFYFKTRAQLSKEAIVGSQKSHHQMEHWINAIYLVGTLLLQLHNPQFFKHYCFWKIFTPFFFLCCRIFYKKELKFLSIYCSLFFFFKTLKQTNLGIPWYVDLNTDDWSNCVHFINYMSMRPGISQTYFM